MLIKEAALYDTVSMDKLGPSEYKGIFALISNLEYRKIKQLFSAFTCVSE